MCLSSASRSLDLPELNATIRHLSLRDGSPASGSTKGTVASVLRRLFAWAREERIIPVNPALELRTGWGGSVRRSPEPHSSWVVSQLAVLDAAAGRQPARRGRRRSLTRRPSPPPSGLPG
jgi:hypothetical protein